MSYGLSDILGLTGGVSWTAGYLPASFRGKAFHVERSTVNGGRKIVEHEFPERDNNENEDIGKKNKHYSISAYVVGDEYYNDRSDLIDALDTKGPGILIHPYYGELSVVVGDYSVDETSTEGRMCRINIDFILDEEIALTIAAPGPYDSLSSAIAEFQQASLSALADVYDIANLPNAILTDITNISQAALDVIAASMTVMNADDNFVKTLNQLKANLSELILSPLTLISEIRELTLIGSDISDSTYLAYYSDDLGRELFDGLQTVSGFQDTSRTEYPRVANNDGDPSKELEKFVSRSALIGMTRLCQTITIKSNDDADNILLNLGELFDSIEEDTFVTDEMYAAARDMRVAVRSIIKSRKVGSGADTSIELSEWDTAINVSYDYYGSSDYDLEICEANEILHPGFVPSGLIRVRSR